LDAANDAPGLIADNPVLVDHDDAVNVLNLYFLTQLCASQHRGFGSGRIREMLKLSYRASFAGW
jgi:hypothetical protein